ncbi:OmpA family protein [Pseudomonas sp. NPDC086581]|uniref:OmpA family protein n=1 Tax=Pseudomonas sp. NPDC086581 TaxID=3364432 RepID=UPI0037F88A07
MTVVEEKLRLGGDPQGHEQSAALGAELAKLNHPARPDVDWPRVERLCLALFREHGMELQSITAFVLARAHLYGLQGLDEGLNLACTLFADDWDSLWPPAPAVRLEMLGWLFSQLRPWLRGLSLSETDVPDLLQLEEPLKELAQLLARREQAGLPALEALRSQLQGLVRRLSPEQDATTNWVVSIAPAEPRPEPTTVTLPAQEQLPGQPQRGDVPQVVVLKLDREEAPVPERRRRLWPWLLTLVLSIVLSGLFAWAHAHGWLGQGWQVVRVEPAPPPASKAVQLDGQLLFPPGKAELRSQSDKVLINSLIDIKAQPGWLIVITGHSDSTGDARRNLELSRDRAAAVRDWMQRMGDIPSDCFEVRGAGDSQPVASDETEEGRNANRRVEITLVPEGGACSKAGETPET